jgi:hypothetical protein
MGNKTYEDGRAVCFVLASGHGAALCHGSPKFLLLQRDILSESGEQSTKASISAEKYLRYPALVRKTDAGYLAVCQIIMVVQIVVGLLGFYLHAVAIASRPTESVTDSFIYGAPVFAPLLFANLAILAIIGLWNMTVVKKSSLHV